MVVTARPRCKFHLEKREAGIFWALDRLWSQHTLIMAIINTVQVETA
jgi:hypothetical protein